jgi:alpha-L-fucosidase
MPILCLVLMFSASLNAGTGSDAPTASNNPRSLDQAWIQASRKYDSKRAEILKSVDSTIQEGPFRPDWQSLQAYEVPKWYRDAKFGIFVHWGVYSVPAFGDEWYPRLMYIEGSDEYKHHIATYGRQNKFGYKDFIPAFKAQKFDPAAWAKLFKESGAKLCCSRVRAS